MIFIIYLCSIFSFFLFISHTIPLFTSFLSLSVPPLLTLNTCLLLNTGRVSSYKTIDNRFWTFSKYCDDKGLQRRVGMGWVEDWMVLGRHDRASTYSDNYAAIVIYSCHYNYNPYYLLCWTILSFLLFSRLSFFHSFIPSFFLSFSVHVISSLNPFSPLLAPQGVLPYYYNVLADPHRSQKVDRCIYNSMADSPECE